MNKLLISKDFTRTPGPRYTKEGKFSGELFRETLLKPAITVAIDRKESLIVDLDGTAGYGTSFLEEAFGGLIREDGLHYEDVVRHMKLVSFEEEYLIDDIFSYLKEASEAFAK